MTQFRITPLNRPVEDQAWMHTPSTPEQQAREAVWVAERVALREQFEREWERPAGYTVERESEEFENLESAAFDVWEERRKGRIAAASTPVWVDVLNYWLIDGPEMENDGLLAQQPTAASLTLPFVLKGGGDMQVTFETKKVVDTKTYGPNPQTWMESKHRLVARTKHGVLVGHLKREYGERSWYLVSLPPNAPPEIADQIATTLDAIQQLNLADDYLAVMPVSNRCSFCSRPLTDIVSKTLGIGPDCAAKWKIPHSAAVADAIIVKRQAFLAEEVTS